MLELSKKRAYVLENKEAKSNVIANAELQIIFTESNLQKLANCMQNYFSGRHLIFCTVLKILLIK